MQMQMDYIGCKRKTHLSESVFYPYESDVSIYYFTKGFLSVNTFTDVGGKLDAIAMFFISSGVVTPSGAVNKMHWHAASEW